MSKLYVVTVSYKNTGTNVKDYPLVNLNYFNGTNLDDLIRQAEQTKTAQERNGYLGLFITVGELTQMTEPPKPPVLTLVPLEL